MKAKLSAEQDKIEKLQTFDSCLFIGQSYFINDGSQNILTFQPIFNTFAMLASHTETTVSWYPKGLSNEITKPPTTGNNGLSPKLKWHKSRRKFEFKCSCLKQNNFYFKKCSKFVYFL